LTQIHPQVAEAARERLRFEQPASAGAAFDAFRDIERAAFHRAARRIDGNEQLGFYDLTGRLVIAHPGPDAGVRPEQRRSCCDHAFAEARELDRILVRSATP